MLNQSVASTPSFSDLDEKIRCAMYPPPPGSAPGYHDAHQLTPRYTAMVMAGIHAALSRGSMASAASVEPYTPSRPASIPWMPPTAWTAKTARMMAPAIASPNWKKSVTTTPQRPATTEYDAASRKHTASAHTFGTCRVTEMISIMARFTHPMMMRLMGTARYAARNPRRIAAGLPP
jgi:hypothetical protein